MTARCPGSQNFSQPKPDVVKCPYCGEEAEIWTDEVKTICPSCENTVLRTQGQSCLDWCKYAKQCVGDSAYNKYIKNKSTEQKSIKKTTRRKQ